MQRERVVPWATMGVRLAQSGADLGNETACVRELQRSGFLCRDITDGLDQAIDRARELRAQTDTPLAMMRDLAAVGLLVCAVFVWAAPARAATEGPLSPSTGAWFLGIVALVALVFLLTGDRPRPEPRRLTRVGMRAPIAAPEQDNAETRARHWECR
jgi:hypothetical protein